MNGASLSDLISAYAVKRLTAHEVDPKVSNGHEFQGVNRLREVLGSERLTEVACTFVWLPDDDETLRDAVVGTVTWYDSRERDSTRSAEWRLYYDSNAGRLIQSVARQDDLFVLARLHDGSLAVFIVSAGSTYERQILLLLGISRPDELNFEVGSIDQTKTVGMVEGMILELLGFEPPRPKVAGSVDVAARLFEQYKGKFPGTDEFSHHARDSYTGVSPIEAPDNYIVEVMEWETAIFRHFEERLVALRLEEGFTKPAGGHDVEGFIKFSRSVGNRRFSRAGYAFEHHMKAVLSVHEIRFDWHKPTEGKRTPDFLFPSAKDYHDLEYSSASLRMLAAKTSCKDRWRQVINEASRIELKHLITLEPGISEAQTDEMREEKTSLVVPLPIQGTYTVPQRAWLVKLVDFLKEVKDLQQ